MPPVHEDLKLYTAAILVGVVGGLGAIVFRLAIWAGQSVFYGPFLNPGSVQFPAAPVPDLFNALANLGDLRFLVVPAVGALLVGLVIYLTTPEVSGHGVPKVLNAILVREGRIDARIALYKTVASSIAIASGASLGREGPIVQIGASTGSTIGRFFRRKANARILVAAGAAAGIAATFNAPLGGIMFAMEIILAGYALRNLIAVVLSATTATMLARVLLHFSASPGVRGFLVPVQYQLVDPAVEIPLYALLGVVAAVAGFLLVRLLYGVEHAFDRLPVPPYVKPVLGALVLGVSALVTAAAFGVSGSQGAAWLFGVGYDTIHAINGGEMGLALLLALAVMKSIGFTFSVGSGSSGGVFSPSLFVGAAVGGAFGAAVGAVVPGVASPGAYALVGMGGVFAAAAGAPLTATLIIFELTGEYTIILPLLVVCVLGSGIAKELLGGSTIYTEKLKLQGITVQNRRIGSLEDLTVSDVMTSPVDTLVTGTSLGEALGIFQRTGHNLLPIVDATGHPVGALRLREAMDALRQSPSAALPLGEIPEDEWQRLPKVEDVGREHLLSVGPHTNLLAAVDVVHRGHVHRLAVVDTDGLLVGLLTERDILRAYDTIASDRTNLPVPLPEQAADADETPTPEGPPRRLKKTGQPQR